MAITHVEFRDVPVDALIKLTDPRTWHFSRDDQGRLWAENCDSASSVMWDDVAKEWV